MEHSLVTVITSVRLRDIDKVRKLIKALGNPAVQQVRDDLENGVLRFHFLSLNVFEASARDQGHLVLEFSGDGDPYNLLNALAARAGSKLGPIFGFPANAPAYVLSGFWASKRVQVGQGPFSNPGLGFCGTPAMSVSRICKEAKLAACAARRLHKLPPDLRGPNASARAKLDFVRSVLPLVWRRYLLEDEPCPDKHAPNGFPSFAAVPSFLRFLSAFAWPLLAAGIAVWLLLLLAPRLLALLPPAGPGPAPEWWLALSLTDAAEVAAWLMLGLTMGLLVWFVTALRRKEAHDIPNAIPATRQRVAAMTAGENHPEHVQNHMAALTQIKPGLLRMLTQRMGFWFIVEIATKYSRPGFLGPLGTIHFARWVRVPRTRDLLFLSNYGGSWESYLEDFITIASQGVNAAWSGAEGFPRTNFLIFKGSSDPDRFKRWARRQMIPTQFWYSAYPRLTTARIRTNADIRRWLATARTEDAAREWLSLFGSEPRPESELEGNEIQSLLFGGFKFLEDSRCIGFRFVGGPEQASAWLAAISSQVSFGDGRKHAHHAVILGLTASGLAKCALPKEGVEAFPPPFVEGMDSPIRAQVLGDVGDDASPNWWWSDRGTELDGILLLYAKQPQTEPGAPPPPPLALDQLQAAVNESFAAYGHQSVVLVDLQRPTTPFEEPFGFVDGVSQPVIRGLYRSKRRPDPIHTVEPGEFILGYADNRGYRSPGIRLDAAFDREGVLPLDENGDRDLGRNGSFLVVRQLEQRVKEFEAYCKAAAEDLKPYYPAGYAATVTPDFVAAKIVGRWKDGRSLVRFPYPPGSAADNLSHGQLRTAEPAQAPAGDAIAPVSHLAVDAPGDGSADAATAAVAAAGAGAILAAGAPGGAAQPLGGGPAAASVTMVPPTGPANTPVAASVRPPDNDFLFGEEDPQGLRCPLGAHIRRANPRESFEPGSKTQLSIVNRHRILRVGRPYRRGKKQGILFMCLNGDIERQFEFVQQTWSLNRSFHGLEDENDPLTGGAVRSDGFTVPTRNGPARLKGLKAPRAFVQTRGGGYFFLPGRRLLQYLATPPGQR